MNVPQTRALARLGKMSLPSPSSSGWNFNQEWMPGLNPTNIILQCCILARASLFSPAYVTFWPTVRHFLAHCTSLFWPCGHAHKSTPHPTPHPPFPCHGPRVICNQFGSLGKCTKSSMWILVSVVVVWGLGYQLQKSTRGCRYFLRALSSRWRTTKFEW